MKPHDGDRYVIQYIDPVAPNIGAIGLDGASEANRRDAANIAMRTGTATLTAPITLVQNPDPTQRAFLLIMRSTARTRAPVRRRNGLRLSTAGLCRALHG